MGVTDYTALLSGYSWVSQESLKTTQSPVFITYSFPAEMTSYDKATYPSLASSWRGFSAGDQQEARAALKQWGMPVGSRSSKPGAAMATFISTGFRPDRPIRGSG